MHSQTKEVNGLKYQIKDNHQSPGIVCNPKAWASETPFLQTLQMVKWWQGGR